MIAKIASDAAKPRGLLEVRAGWEEGVVAGLPLRALPGIGPRTAERLAAVGLTTVWEVQQKSVGDLEKLVGRDASRLKHRAHGHGGTTLRAGRAARSISRETTLAVDATDPSRLERLLTLFAARIGAELRDTGLVTRTVTLKLRHGDFRTVTRSRTLDEPTDLDDEILRTARALFTPAFAEARDRNQGVRLLGIAATNLLEASPPDLFEAPERTRRRDLTRALDRVREKYGFDAVKKGELIEKKREQ
jgi:DNA polymerase-4